MPASMAEPTTPTRVPVMCMKRSAASSRARYWMDPIAGLIESQPNRAFRYPPGVYREHHFIQKIGTRKQPYGPVTAAIRAPKRVNAADDGRMLPPEIAIHPEGFCCEDQIAEGAESSSVDSLKPVSRSP